MCYINRYLYGILSLNTWDKCNRDMLNYSSINNRMACLVLYMSVFAFKIIILLDTRYNVIISACHFLCSRIWLWETKLLVLTPHSAISVPQVPISIPASHSG